EPSWDERQGAANKPTQGTEAGQLEQAEPKEDHGQRPTQEPAAGAVYPIMGSHASFTFSRVRIEFRQGWAGGRPPTPSPIGYFPIEKVRSMRVMFPWWSFTDTVSVPLCNSEIGWARRSSHLESDSSLNFLARFSPAATPSTAKSATTWNASISSPLS